MLQTTVYLVNMITLGDDDDEFFLVWLTDERRLALFPVGTIVRDSHHPESLARRKRDLDLHRT